MRRHLIPMLLAPLVTACSVTRSGPEVTTALFSTTCQQTLERLDSVAVATRPFTLYGKSDWGFLTIADQTAAGRIYTSVNPSFADRPVETHGVIVTAECQTLPDAGARLLLSTGGQDKGLTRKLNMALLDGLKIR